MRARPTVPAILLLGAMGALSGYYLAVHGVAVFAAWGAFLRVGAGLLLLVLHLWSGLAPGGAGL